MTSSTADWSFLELKSVEDILTKTPRNEEKDGAGAATDEKTASDDLPKPRYTAVKLCYNQLTNLDRLDEFLAERMENPLEYVTLLDIAHNQLTTVPNVLLKFKNLTVLYMHANCITKLTEINKLKALTNLQKLTLHGNAVVVEAPGPGQQKKTIRLEETSKFYRLRVIYELRATQLRALDFISVTPKDRETAELWNKNHRKKPKPKVEDDDSGGGSSGYDSHSPSQQQSSMSMSRAPSTLPSAAAAPARPAFTSTTMGLSATLKSRSATGAGSPSKTATASKLPLIGAGAGSPSKAGGQAGRSGSPQRKR